MSVRVNPVPHVQYDPINLAEAFDYPDVICYNDGKSGIYY
jgi:hypothetical protein